MFTIQIKAGVMIDNYLALYIFSFFNVAVVLICLYKLESINPSYPSPIRVSQNRRTIQHVRAQSVISVIDVVDNIGIVSNRTLHKIEYGSPQSYGKPAPIVMIRKQLDTAVLQRFLQYPMFSCNQTELDAFDTLDRRVVEPFYIYEGYFHSMKTNEKIFSRNPNPLIGKDFMKPAADRFLRAFYETFRRINNAIFTKLKTDLLESANSRSQENISDACFVFAKWIERGLLFGDLSIQIHYGKTNEEKFAKAWHTDAENSLLHFAITLRGNRVLHSKRSDFEQRDILRPASELMEQQHPGDAYLTSSALMLHAPLFPTAKYDERTIAIHARVLYTSQEVALLRSASTVHAWKALINIIANTLSHADLKMPNLAQITAVEAEIS